METQHLSVTGMTCQGCVDSIARKLHAISGVKSADVSLASRSATIQFDERLTSVDELEQAVQHAGYGVIKNGAPESPPGKATGCCSG